MEKKEVWSTSDIIANRNNWSLAADVELLKHLQALSEKIFTKASWTLHSLKSFENDLNQTCISVANTSNKFKSLSDTQFIESKVQEESADINQLSSLQAEPPVDHENENIAVKLKEALENGFRVLDTQYDLIPVSGSDSEDDEPQEILLRARNPYLGRRLPHIIGSEEFTRNDNLGLIDDSSSEDDEEEEDDDYDDTDDNDVEENRAKVGVESDDESITIQKPPSLKNEFIRPRTEIIRISSSDSEDSEGSIPCNKKQEEITSVKKNTPSEKYEDGESIHNPNSFAEHLNAALKNTPRNIYDAVPPDFGESFSPPPFPGKDNSASSDDDSDGCSDIFASKKNTKHSSYVNESDVDSDWNPKIAVISKDHNASGKPLESFRKSPTISRTSQYSNSSTGSSISNEVLKKDSTVTSDQFDSHLLPKPKTNEPKINSMHREMASAINSEISAKLNLKNSCTDPVKSVTSTKNSSKSIESRIPAVTAPKPSKSSTPVKIIKPTITTDQMVPSSLKKDSKKSALFDQLDDKNSSEEDNEDDLFRTVQKAKSKSKRSEGLFEDDGNIENLFSPLKPAPRSMKKPGDLSPFNPSEPTKSDKVAIEPDFKPPVVDLFKKPDLFASDSESEDDIFSIIKSKKTETGSIFGSGSNDLKGTSIPSNNTETTKTPTFGSIKKSTLLEVQPQSLLAEEKSSKDLNSKKLMDSAKQSINEEINVTSSSENSLFEDIKTASNLFHLDNDDDDLFSKNARSADSQTFAREHTNVSKFSVPSDIVSSTSTNKNENIIKEKPNFGIASANRRSSSSESVNYTECRSPENIEDTAQSDEKNNTSVKIQSFKYSSSSESEMEGVKNNNFGGKLSRNGGGKVDVDESFKQDFKQTASTQEESFSGEYGNDEGTKNDNLLSSQKNDISTEFYDSRSAVFLPPKDGFSDGFSEDEEIKENNYLFQDEDDDSSCEKFEPPQFGEVVQDDDLFGEKLPTNILPKSQKNLVIDASSTEDLFAKSSTLLPPNNLLHRSHEFAEQKHVSEKNYDSGQKLSTGSEKKIDSAEKATLSPKPSDDVLNDPKGSGLFNFSENEIFSSEFDRLSVASEDKFNSVSVTAKVDESKDTEQTTPLEKPSESDGFNFFKNQIEKLNDNLQKNRIDKKPASNPKIGKISTDIFEKSITDKKLDEDEQDGNVLGRSTSSESVSSSRSVPGKLTTGRGLNINVNALLPGSNWSSKMKQKQSSEHVSSDEKSSDEPAVLNKPQNIVEKSTNILSNVIKERPKVSGKRRPPTRQARKSRMVSNDVFGDGFAVELPSEENELNAGFDSPKSYDRAEIRKPENAENDFTSKDILFGSDNEKNEEEFNIIIKQPVSGSQKSDLNLPEGSYSDLSLDANSSLNKLPCLTKIRAKPQKRSLISKNTASDTPPDVHTGNSVPPEKIKSQPTSKNEDTLSASSAKATPSSIKTSAAKSIFDSLEEDDDNLFETVKSEKAIEERPVPEIKANIETTQTSKPREEPTITKPKTVKNANADIFNDDDDDDDQLFSSTKKKFSTSKFTKKNSLFEDNDDDDLFGAKTSTSSSRKTSDVAVSSATTKVLNEKPRVIKLRSESVQKDPLSGKDLSGPL